MEQARSASLIRSLRYDLRSELRNKKFSYHFITYFEIAKLSRSDTEFTSLYKYLLEWSSTNAGL